MGRPSVWLGSSSPRRRELLALTGLRFGVAPAAIDESLQPGEAPAAFAQRLAREKAEQVGPMYAGDLVIAADTIVVAGGDILGKPRDAGEARVMLRRLWGRTHTVITAIALRRSVDGVVLVDRCHTDVPIREFSGAELDDYVASGDPLDKAGGYAIQNESFHPAERLQGCFANVVGLPLCHLVRNLRRLGLSVPHDVPTACQTHLAYDCPVYEQILGDEL